MKWKKIKDLNRNQRWIDSFRNISFMTFQTCTGMETVIHISNLFIANICFGILKICKVERFQRSFYPLSIFHVHIFILTPSMTFFSQNIKKFSPFFLYLWLCHSFNENRENKRYWQDIIGYANHFPQVTSFKQTCLGKQYSQ